MQGVGLVLEGGGMRGVYTAGVLEYFMEQSWYFPYVVGVSAGACNAASYISRQQGRNKRVTIGYIGDPRYLSYRNWLRHQSLFGMDFIFQELPNKLEPFDFDAFYASPQTFVIGTTDAFTGEAVYYTKQELMQDTLQIIQASSSLPFVSKPVRYGERILFDGGLADPLPLDKSMSDGNSRHIIISTKEYGYRKSPFKQKWLARSFYPRYKGLVETMCRRSAIYNETMARIEELERQGDCLVIRPSASVPVTRMEKNKQSLQQLYDLGYADAKSLEVKLRSWLEER